MHAVPWSCSRVRSPRVAAQLGEVFGPREPWTVASIRLWIPSIAIASRLISILYGFFYHSHVLVASCLQVYEVKRDSSRLKSLQTLVSLLDYLRQGPAAAAGGAGSPAALALEQARMEEHGRVVSLFAMASLRHLQPGGVSSEKLLALPLLEAYAGVVEALTKGSAGKAFLESLAASFAAGAPGLESDAVPLVVGMMGGLSLLPAPLGVAVRLMGVAYRALKGWGRLAQSESSSPATTAYAEAVRALEVGHLCLCDASVCSTVYLHSTHIILCLGFLVSLCSAADSSPLRSKASRRSPSRCWTQYRTPPPPGQARVRSRRGRQRRVKRPVRCLRCLLGCSRRRHARPGRWRW